jgi:hypothetical protein
MILYNYFDGSRSKDAAGLAPFLVNPALEIIFNRIPGVHISGRNRAKLRIFRRGKNGDRVRLPSQD